MFTIANHWNYYPSTCVYLLFNLYSFVEFASKKYGLEELQIRQIMMARISNVVKAIKLKAKKATDEA